MCVRVRFLTSCASWLFSFLIFDVADDSQLICTDEWTPISRIVVFRADATPGGAAAFAWGYLWPEAPLRLPVSIGKVFNSIKSNGLHLFARLPPCAAFLPVASNQVLAAQSPLLPDNDTAIAAQVIHIAHVAHTIRCSCLRFLCRESKLGLLMAASAPCCMRPPSTLPRPLSHHPAK